MSKRIKKYYSKSFIVKSETKYQQKQAHMKEKNRVFCCYDSVNAEW